MSGNEQLRYMVYEPESLFEKKVNKMIREGWIPVDGVQVADTDGYGHRWLAQAMVRNSQHKFHRVERCENSVHEATRKGMAELTLPLPPSANRYWRNFRGRMVISSEARDYKNLVAHLCAVNRYQQLTGPVAVAIDVYRQRKAGDLDNFLKCLFDAFSGYLYNDDAQIVEIRARRFDDKNNPRVEVKVMEVTC